MPKTRRIQPSKAQEKHLADIMAKYVDQLVAAVTQEARHSVAAEVKNLLKNAPKGKADRRPRKARKRRILPCIAPGCGNPSKGPRFHYLCDEHKGAGKKQIEAWREAKMEKKAA